MKREADDDLLNYILPAVHSKGQQRQVQIVEAAIMNFATIGVEKTTPDKIAKTCGVSRPLVLHYFPNTDSIFPIAVKLIRSRFQKLAVDAMEKGSSPTLKLKAYVESTFKWIRVNPEHVKVWLLFYYYCGLRREYRDLNSELVDMGHARITALLDLGEQRGEFTVKDTASAAKMIQNIVTGALLCVATETLSSRLASVEKQTTASCLLIAGGSKK